MQNKRRIIITGSEGLIGSQLVKHFEKTKKVLKLDILLNHDLNNEKFVKKWFKENKADYLINCFALNDHGNTKNTLFSFPLNSFSKYLDVTYSFAILY